MKSKIIVLLCAVAVSFCASAQDMFDSGNTDARFGVRLSWDLNSPSTNIESYGSGSGLSIGALYNMPLYKNLYFEPGLSFFYNTMSIQQYEGAIQVDGTWRNSGFRVPMAFGYRFDIMSDISLSVYTGPQINYGFYLKEKYGNQSIGLYGNGWHHFDAQWLFGVRFHYANNWIAEIGGGAGLNNLLSGDWGKVDHIRRNTFTIGVGYMF